MHERTVAAPAAGKLAPSNRPQMRNTARAHAAASAVDSKLPQPALATNLQVIAAGVPDAGSLDIRRRWRQRRFFAGVAIPPSCAVNVAARVCTGRPTPPSPSALLMTLTPINRTP